MPGVPKGAAELQAGRRPEPTAEQLHKLALSARTRTDHLALREYYMNVAGKRAAEAAEHLRMATGYRAAVGRACGIPPRPVSDSPGSHARRRLVRRRPRTAIGSWRQLPE